MQKANSPSSGQPCAWKSRSKTCSACISRAMAYIEMPELKTVIAANMPAFSVRVFPSKRSPRNSGTERAFEP